MSDVVLALHGLRVRYGAIEAVKGIDLEVLQGQVVALLGANGAGKTSTLRAISGLTRAADGSIEAFGRTITRLDAAQITRLGIVQSPEGRQIFRDLTVEENLRAGAYTIRDRTRVKRNLQRCYGYFPRLEERAAQMSFTLSGGELQMLAIGRALMSDPKLLLLDEPSLGLAPLIVQEIFQIIQEIRATGTTVLIVEQNARQTLRIADYGYVLEVGRNSAQGPASELLQDARLVEAYLGRG